MNAWELAEDEYREVARSQEQVFFGTMIEPTYRAIASAAVKKYQEWLAKDEPRPCEKCQFYHRKYKQDPQCDLYNCNPYESGHKCPEWMHWQGRREGQIQGYAKGRQEVLDIVRQHGTESLARAIEGLQREGEA